MRGSVDGFPVSFNPNTFWSDGIISPKAGGADGFFYVVTAAQLGAGAHTVRHGGALGEFGAAAPFFETNVETKFTIG